MSSLVDVLEITTFISRPQWRVVWDPHRNRSEKNLKALAWHRGLQDTWRPLLTNSLKNV